MRIYALILLILAAGLLHAEDTKPTPLATVEQLQAKVAEQQKEIVKLQQKLTIYQQSAFRCQDAMLDAQIEAQQKQQAKPKETVK